MADAVTATKVEDGPKKATFYLTNTSDGTGEAAVTKIDVSALAALQDGTVCTGVRIENITFTNVLLRLFLKLLKLFKITTAAIRIIQKHRFVYS